LDSANSLDDQSRRARASHQRGAFERRDEADYLLFVDRKAIGTVEAKPEVTPLPRRRAIRQIGKGLLDIYPKWREHCHSLTNPLASETQFTNQLDPSPKSRNVFAFHKPETLLDGSNPNAA